MTVLQLSRDDGLQPRSFAMTALQIGLIALLVYVCSRIVLPFLGILLWSTILAVMLYPLHVRTRRRIGNGWSAFLIGFVGVALLLAPMIFIATSLASTASTLVVGLQNQTLTLPPPPPRLASVPLVGERLTETWALAASSMPDALAKYGPMLRKPLSGVAGMVGNLAAAELAFILSFIIAAVLIAYGEGVAGFARRLLGVLTSSRAWGERLVALTAATIRGVAVGVVGVAAIQAVLLGAGFFAIGLPGAVLVTLAVFLLGVIQVPATLLTIPVIAYVFFTEPTLAAVIFGVWTILAGLSDNLLKPLMLGRGMEVPMPVILIGVIGGMIADGLLGLFVGPVVLAIAYVLFAEWLKRQPAEEAAATPPASP